MFGSPLRKVLRGCTEGVRKLPEGAGRCALSNRQSTKDFFLSFPSKFEPHYDMTAETPLLKLESVTKRYDSPDRSGFLTVLDRVSLEVGRGESLAIVGPSG